MRSSSLILWLVLACAGLLLVYAGRRLAGEKGSGLAARTAKPPQGVPHATPPSADLLLSITCCDEAGNPVEGASVSLSRYEGTRWYDIAGLRVKKAVTTKVATGHTDSKGRLILRRTLPPGSYLIEARGAVGAARVGPLQFPMKKPLVLRPPGSLRATGLPGPGVPVLAVSPETYTYLSTSVQGGTVSFENLPPGAYGLLIGDPEVQGIARVPHPPAPAPQLSYPYNVQSGETLKVDLTETVESLAELRGRVEGARHGEILCRSASRCLLCRTHRLGGNGSFAFRFLPPGRYDLVVAPAAGPAHEVSVDLQPGDRRELVFSFPLRALTGTVRRFSDRVPYAGLEILLEPIQGGGAVRTVTGPDGSFSLSPLIPGSYRLTVRSPSGNEPPFSLTVRVREDPTEVQLAYPPAPVSGREE